MSTNRGYGLHAVSLGVIAIGIGVVYGTTLIPVTPISARVGPTIFPFAVGAILIVLGALLMRDALARNWDCEATDPEAPSPDLVPLGWVAAGLVLNLVLIKPLGFILSSTIMYIFVAQGFGARRLWLAALVGFALALLAYFGFAQLLGLRMGGGLIEDMI